MPKRPRPDLDERFTLHPVEAEDALRRLLDGDDKAPEGKPKRPKRPAR